METNKINEGSLPRESTVKQLKKIKKKIRKEIGGDAGDRINKSKKGIANLVFMRDPIENGIESFEDFKKSNKKIFKFEEFSWNLHHK